MNHIYGLKYPNYYVNKNIMEITLFIFFLVWMDMLVQIRSIFPILSCFSVFFQHLFVLFDVNYKMYFFLWFISKDLSCFSVFFQLLFLFLTKLYNILLFIIYIKNYEQDLKKHRKIRQKREDGPHLNQHVHLDQEEYEEFFFFHLTFVYIKISIF